MVVWGNWAEGRAASNQDEIFQAAVLASNDVECAGSGWLPARGKSTCVVVQPRQRLFLARFCALGFPFSA